VVPRLSWLNPQNTRLGTPRILFDGTGLAGGLASMLLLAAARAEVVLPCAEPGCTALAKPARRGAKPYCAYHLGRGVRSRDRGRTFLKAHPTHYRDRRARLTNPKPAHDDPSAERWRRS